MPAVLAVEIRLANGAILRTPPMLTRRGPKLKMPWTAPSSWLPMYRHCARYTWGVDSKPAFRAIATCNWAEHCASSRVVAAVGRFILSNTVTPSCPHSAQPTTYTSEVTAFRCMEDSLCNGSADNHPLDVVCAFVNLAHSHITIDTFNREVGHVAAAAVNLNCV